jgi:hypothetical protein
MIKRTVHVLLIILTIVGIPFLAGCILDFYFPVNNPSVYILWLTGFIVLFIVTISFIVIGEIAIRVINYIKYGE